MDAAFRNGNHDFSCGVFNATLTGLYGGNTMTSELRGNSSVTIRLGRFVVMTLPALRQAGLHEPEMQAMDA
ncbi:hypothetical protein GCM10008955_42290 [Deinococcus malanensis]|uniref:Uncharacterized protein n=1 Tax=Deinococcus malanensis TaxID=1706855 RepID=A0ABQ2F5W9_9DEIO|nr:hypothetical protein GCM10008955_42290 [Deinococcus malanensis]